MKRCANLFLVQEFVATQHFQLEFRARDPLASRVLLAETANLTFCKSKTPSTIIGDLAGANFKSYLPCGNQITSYYYFLRSHWEAATELWMKSSMQLTSSL